MTETIDDRKEARFPFHWSVAMVFDGSEAKDTYHGVTHELSVTGCSILMEQNVFTDHPVTILLALPLDYPGERQRLVEVKARMIYTVLSAGHQQFRCGIRFERFKGSGRSILQRAIKQRVTL